MTLLTLCLTGWWALFFAVVMLMGYIETRPFRRQFGVDVVQSERCEALPVPPDPPCRHRPVDSSRVSVGTSTLDERKARMLAWEEIKRIEREHGLVNGSLVQEP